MLACVTTLFTVTTLAGHAEASTDIAVSPSGHYITYQGTPLLLAGDSGTHVVMQNPNIDYRQWIDDCADRGIRAAHIWSFVAPRQKQDGSVVESRYGYVYPGITPWARKTSGPNGTDQLKQWDLQTFDEGPEEDATHYWPRLRDLVGYADSKDMAVGITVFFGWPKHNTAQRPDWSYHPLNVVNGGPVTDSGQPVTQVQIIDSPGTEVWTQAWSDGWSTPKKTQWIWERFSKKLIDETDAFGNVFFAFMDEHSYSEGNMGDHFRDFFRSRGQVWMDWSDRRSSVDWVVSSTFGGDDKNGNAVSGFNGSPVRPYVFLEGEPYKGDGVRTAIWTFMTGGGNYFFHADERQETVRTGIMGYDPNVLGGDKGMYKRDWLGHASRFFNEHVDHLDTMAPHNELCGANAYCLGDPGVEYVVYAVSGGNLSVDLSDALGRPMNVEWYDPRTGVMTAGAGILAAADAAFVTPDANDWVLRLTLGIGDMNEDGAVNGLDVDPFVDVLLSGTGDPILRARADVNEDGYLNGLDVDPFVAIVVGTASVGGSVTVPEPSALTLLVVGTFVWLCGKRHGGRGH